MPCFNPFLYIIHVVKGYFVRAKCLPFVLERGKTLPNLKDSRFEFFFQKKLKPRTPFYQLTVLIPAKPSAIQT